MENLKTGKNILERSHAETLRRLIVRSAMQGRDSYLIELADAIRSHANDNLSNSYYSLLGTHLRLECLKKE